MAYTADANGWQGRGWRGPGWQGPNWQGPASNGQGPGGPGNGGPFYYGRPCIHPLGILLVILGFMVWWPLGLALLLAKLWRTSMGCGHDGHWEHKMERLQRKMDWVRARMEGGFGDRRGWQGGRNWRTSGNHAFDEYRAETLKRLEDEQSEFKDFLDRLRHAKDKAEFDQFMADRKSRPASPPDQPQQG